MYATPETSTGKPETSDNLFQELFADLQQDSVDLNNVPLSKEIHNILLVSAPVWGGGVEVPVICWIGGRNKKTYFQYYEKK